MAPEVNPRCTVWAGTWYVISRTRAALVPAIQFAARSWKCNTRLKAFDFIFKELAPMPQPKTPPTERINSSFKKLARISPELHAAGKELTKTIDTLNDALEPLSLRVAAWATIAKGGDNNGNYWSRSIGYAYVDNRWGIALKQESGNEMADETHDENTWPFSKAPRWMAIESIAKLPELFETLIERVQDTIVKLKARTEQTKELVAAINSAAAELEGRKDEK